MNDFCVLFQMPVTRRTLSQKFLFVCCVIFHNTRPELLPETYMYTLLIVSFLLTFDYLSEAFFFCLLLAPLASAAPSAAQSTRLLKFGARSTPHFSSVAFELRCGKSISPTAATAPPHGSILVILRNPYSGTR